MVKVVLYYFDLAVEAVAAAQKIHVVLAAAVEAEEHRRPALVLAILLCPEEVVERVEVLIVAVERSLELSVLVVRLLEVLSRKHLEGWLGSRGYSISREARQRRIQIGSRLHGTHIPKFCPSSKIWMINTSLWIDMLTGSHHHSFCWRDVYQWLDSRVLVGYPYCNRKAICCSSKRDRQGA